MRTLALAGRPAPARELRRTARVTVSPAIFVSCFGVASAAPVAFGCSSTPTPDGGTDASVDAPVADAPPGVTYSCDVTALTSSALACPKWSGIPTAAPEAGSPLGTMACPIAPPPWNNSGDLLARMCIYTWGGAGPPDVCTLPVDEGRPPFTWLAPACNK